VSTLLLVSCNTDFIPSADALLILSKRKLGCKSAAVSCSRAHTQYHRIGSHLLPSNKSVSAHAVPAPSLPPASIHHLTFCLSSPRCSSDLLQATQEDTVNVPLMADTLMERVGNASWVVVFKALITTHHLMVTGNEVRR